MVDHTEFAAAIPQLRTELTHTGWPEVCVPNALLDRSLPVNRSYIVLNNRYLIILVYVYEASVATRWLVKCVNVDEPLDVELPTTNVNRAAVAAFHGL